VINMRDDGKVSDLRVVYHYDFGFSWRMMRFARREFGFWIELN